MNRLPPDTKETTLPDEVRTLAERSLAGDQAAMFALVDRFQGQVFGLCYRMLSHRQDAEDTAQDTFSRALRSLANWDRDRPFLPWLLAIAGNRCRTFLAQRRQRPPVSPLVEHLPDREHLVEPANNLAEELELALGQLRNEYRQAFLLFHQHELSYAEIASALDCPLGTVKTWVHRARQEIIEILKKRGALAEAPHALRRI
ncbi:MAG: RNA polymerase sigma factor [Pirellulales bacterium]|nr:RNA polymerase sigma factor [Pirellulales bacterium]